MTDHKKPDTFSTDVGAPPVKRPIGVGGIARPDIADDDQVFDLAARMVTAPRRELMSMTLAEQRAICAFATRMAVIATNAAEYVRLQEDPPTSNSPEAVAQYRELVKRVLA